MTAQLSVREPHLLRYRGTYLRNLSRRYLIGHRQSSLSTLR